MEKETRAQGSQILEETQKHIRVSRVLFATKMVDFDWERRLVWNRHHDPEERIVYAILGYNIFASHHHTATPVLICGQFLKQFPKIIETRGDPFRDIMLL